MTPARASLRPTRVSGVVAVAAGALAVLVAIDRPAAVAGLAVLLVGCSVAAVGAGLVGRSRRSSGRVVEWVGLVVAVVAVPVAVVASTTPGGSIALVPGLVGCLLLAVALLPAYGSGSRRLVRLGSGLAFAAVLLAALFHLSPPTRALVGVVLVVVAWDAGDHAVDLGAQLGTRARTWPSELVHVGATGLVGFVGVAGAELGRGLSVASLPLTAFVLVLLAVIALTLALHG